MNNETKRVIIASKNPVKIEAASKGFQKLLPSISFDFMGISAASNVPDQPRGSEETLLGAKNRAENAKHAESDADYWVGIEGGIDTTDNGTEVFAWVYILDKDGRIGYGKTGSFYLPAVITRLLDEGLELGEADDRVFSQVNSKQSSGSVGILTKDVIDREKYYVDAVIFALIPFANHQLYFEEITPAPQP
jgi:inosine/xanthosine triphosphatase